MYFFLVISSLKKFLLLLLFFVTFGVASTVIEDSRSRLVLEDMAYAPMNANALEGEVYRQYSVALPSNEKPTVRVAKVSLVPLQLPASKVDSVRIQPLFVGTPYMRDGLWICDIVVPLFEKHGRKVSLRKKFELSVEFARAASGVYPGKRAVDRVINRKAAARFGVERGKARKALRRAATQSDLDRVKFLATLRVGDRDVASFSEDGQYAVRFETLRKALETLNRENDIDGLSIDKICIYGANPDTLSDKVPGTDLITPNQIFEIPIEIRDHSRCSRSPCPADKIFGPGDSLLFVGYGTSIWKRMDKEDPTYKNGTMDYFHSYSPYSFYQSFLVGYKNSGKGMRVSTLSSPAGSAKTVPFLRYVRGEKDVTLRDSYFGKDLEWDETSGKEWFWFWHSRFDSTTLFNASLTKDLPQTVDLPGFVKDGKNYVAVSYFPFRSVQSSTAERDGDQMGGAELSAQSYEWRMQNLNFSMDVNGKIFRGGTLVPGGNFRLDNVPLKAKGNTYSLTMLPDSVQYSRFDGFTVAYEWLPQTDDAEWVLPGAVSGIIKVPVKGSDLRLMKFKDYVPQGLLPIENGFAKDSIAAGDDVRYLLYRKGSFHRENDILVEAIPNHEKGVLENLSAINNKTEYLILTPTEFARTANELAKFRSEGGAIATFKTSVVQVEDIYRYYKGGSLSPVAIRNYLAYAKSMCPNLKYVLLVGYGHYDYRGLIQKMPNFIPPFEKEDAVSEDFYGVLDSGEVVLYGDYDIDLVVGRLTVVSEDEFRIYLSKAMDYDSVGRYDHSSWRSTLILAADDAKNDNKEDNTGHTAKLEDLARTIDEMSREKKYRWNQKKIYLLDYKENSSGQKKDAAQHMIDALNQGALITNYFGHASVTDWAGEGLLKTSYIPRLHNKKLYTILNSFSCSTSKFDDGKTVSLTHSFVVSPDKGGIAAIGATRETFANSNELFATGFMRSALFDSLVTLGDAFLNAKKIRSADEMGDPRSFSGRRYNSERYVLFGEPVVMMPYQKGYIKLDSNLDTLKALDKVKLSGSVSGIENGKVHLSLRDGRYNKKLYVGYEIANSTDTVSKDSVVRNYATEKNDSVIIIHKDTLAVSIDGALIYSEDVNVVNGRFNVEFITPRKMSFGDTAVEFQAWAYSDKVKPISRYWKEGIVISGMSSYADSIHDETPPSIYIQPCLSGFKPLNYADSQVVDLQSPACLQVIFEDSTALDYREQADEGITFEIVGWQTPFHPYPYLEQTSKRAVVKMNFASESYPEGRYVFKAVAYDVLGNRGEKTVIVNITDEMKSGLADVFNVPNPMGKKGTTFYFKNYAGERGKVNIFIYNQNGKLVKVIKNAVSGVTHWDGRDNHGRLLANGLYHYVVRNEAAATEEFKKGVWKKKQKLLISR